MSSRQLTDGKKRELAELVEGWGKIAAERVYGIEGPGLDVDLAALEEVAVEMQQAVLRGFCEATTQRQSQGLPCPECGRECEVEPLDGPLRGVPAR